MRVILALIFLFLVTINCNRGPAQDRGKKGCESAKLTFLLSYSIASDYSLPAGDVNKEVAEIIAKSNLLYFIGSECDPSERDSMLERYYRGYINGKE